MAKRGTKIHFYRGYYIYPGRIAGGSDDVLGTWYVVHENDDLVSTQGRGHPTLAAAKQAIEEAIGKAPWKYTKLNNEWVALGQMPDPDTEWPVPEIAIITRRGHRHVRRVTKVLKEIDIGQGKALLYVGLEYDSQIEHDAEIHLIDTRLKRSEQDLTSWIRYFERSHDIAYAHSGSSELAEVASNVHALVRNLRKSLMDYVRISVPRKHPIPAWLVDQSESEKECD